jgi:hypothetical protein
MLEKYVVKEIREALGKNYPGCFHFKSHGSMYQIIGLPDIICSIKGRFVGIEVKAPGKEDTLTKIQKKVIQDINNSGGIAFMATSGEQAIQELRGRLNVKEKGKNSHSRKNSSRE